MIKDDLTLDGTPTLNLASFVTTYMVCVFCFPGGVGFAGEEERRERTGCDGAGGMMVSWSGLAWGVFVG